MRVWILFMLGLAGCGTGNDDGGVDGGTSMDGALGCSVQPNFPSLHENLFSARRCSVLECHLGDSPAAKLGLALSAAEVHTQLVGAATDNDEDKAAYPTRVVAGDPSASYLYIKLTDPTVNGSYGRMPPGAPLHECQIAAVERWIRDGASN